MFVLALLTASILTPAAEARDVAAGVTVRTYVRRSLVREYRREVWRDMNGISPRTHAPCDSGPCAGR